jgi:hypothetical protein
MPDKITKCVSCANGVSFTDQPAEYADQRWPGHDHPAENRWTRCDNCGASYIVDFVDPSVRKAGD